MKGGANGRVGISLNVKKLALSYEREHLWKKNKSLALVLLRFYKGRRNNDILEHISSFLDCPGLDLDEVERREDFHRNGQYCPDCDDWYVGTCGCTSDTGYIS